MQKVIRILFSGIVASLITLVLIELEKGFNVPTNIQGPLNILFINKELIIFILVFGLIFFTFARFSAKRIADKLEKVLIKYPLQEILMYIIGLAIGLGVANLIGSVLVYSGSSSIQSIWAGLLYLGLGYFGIYIVHLKKDEVRGWFNKKGTYAMSTPPKLLDTSVIIDGRILDIIRTHFIEGKIIIPQFILDELRHIADSSDSLKRNRGRRGLDILREIQAIKGIPVEIVDIDYKSIEEVDMKLLKLAEDLQGIVVTNDFNLNKVAQLQKVVVLNINDLAHAVKPIVLPKEEMTVTIIKEGKEQEQGVAYLNDGTMIVVEGGKKFVGEAKNVMVSTVLQTSAGRMIFAKVIV